MDQTPRGRRAGRNALGRKLLLLLAFVVVGLLAAPAVSAVASPDPQQATATVTAAGASKPSTPPCPSGSTLNKATKMCEVAPTAAPCSAPFVNVTTFLCGVQPTITCPTGTQPISILNRCAVQPTCPPGGTFSGDCLGDPAYGCPDGFELTAHPSLGVICLNFDDSLCPPGFSYSSGTCGAPPTRICPVGTGTVPRLGECVGIATDVTCDLPGWAYNAADGWCEATFACVFFDELNNLPLCSGFSDLARDCPSGTTRTSTTMDANRTYSICSVAGTSGSCADGVYLAASGGCRALPMRTCPPGFDWNPVLNACAMTAGFATDCPPDATFTQLPSGQGVCIVSPTFTCADGALDSSTGTCVLPSTPSCSVGSYNAQTDRCETPPSINCSVGTYNPSTDRCEQEPSPTCREGFDWNPTVNFCTMLAGFASDCPSGTTFTQLPSGQGVCVEGAGAGCPSGSELSGDTCVGLLTHVCSAGTYDEVVHRCVTAPTVTCSFGSFVDGFCRSAPACSVGSYNPQLFACEAAPTAVTCPTGSSLDTAFSLCMKAAPLICPSTFKLNTTRNPPVCEVKPGVSGGKGK